MPGEMDTRSAMTNWLSANADAHALENEHAAASTEKPLAEVAKKYESKFGVRHTDEEYIQMARGAISSFIQQKRSGEHSSAMGKTKDSGPDASHIARVLSELRYY